MPGAAFAALRIEPVLGAHGLRSVSILRLSRQNPPTQDRSSHLRRRQGDCIFKDGWSSSHSMMRRPMTRAKTTGGCLCGAVRYEIDGPLPAPSACHCGQCRRQHGALGVYTLAPTDRYKIKGKRHIAWYESSPGIRRGFCKICARNYSGSASAAVNLTSRWAPSTHRGAEDRKADLYCRCRRLLRPAQPMSLSQPAHVQPAGDGGRECGAGGAAWPGTSGAPVFPMCPTRWPRNQKCPTMAVA